MEPKRLYRSLTDRKIGGVAGGLAEYFVIDPLLIRLAFVVLMLAGGGGFLIYIILWIVTPDNPMRITSAPAGSPSTEYQQPAGDNGATSGETYSPMAESTTPPVPQTKERNKGSLIGGMVLITLGVIFLADQFFTRINFGDLWPVILIVIGLGLLINTVTKRNHPTNNF